MSNIVLEQQVIISKELEEIYPLQDEVPSDFSERLGLSYSAKVTEIHKRELGQYFTRKQIASFMASSFKVNKEKVKILDPGCGTAILSCALSEHLSASDKVKAIEITLYETDTGIIPYLEKSLSYLNHWLADRKIKLTYNIVETDFVLDNHSALENSELKLFKQNNSLFDIIISNPPYFKISKSDERAEYAKAVVHGQPNIYAIFFAIAANLLEKDGELIFIMPRSFTSGFYFRLFREQIFSVIQPTDVHLFVSRREAFDRDKVLQENLIIKAKKREDISVNRVNISTSTGIKDLDLSSKKEYIFNELIDLKSYHKIFYLPSSDKENKIMQLFKTWQGSLNLYNIQISTGPVVPFRNKEFIYNNFDGESTYAPLFWLHNIAKMEINFLRKINKGHLIKICDESRSLLLSNKNCILMRRFSSKDDKSRLIAAPYFSEFTNSEYIGVENHLNYIYRPKGELTKTEILGLAGFLNSSLLDTYFRTFSGNTQVSATELREIPLPSLELIIEIGEQLSYLQNFTQETIDNTVDKILKSDE